MSCHAASNCILAPFVKWEKKLSYRIKIITIAVSRRVRRGRENFIVIDGLLLPALEFPEPRDCEAKTNGRLTMAKTIAVLARLHFDY
jgi:hypothetical protein